MRSTHLLTASLALTCVYMCGCAALQVRSDREDLEPDEAARDTDEAPIVENSPSHVPIFPTLRRTERPDSAPWLLDQVEVTFRELEASEAIGLIVGDRPLNFQIRLPDIPYVTYASASDHTAQDALNAVVAQADWSYEVIDDTIHVRDLETRTLLLLAQPGVVEATMSVNSLDAGSGGGTERDGGTVQHSSDPYQTELDPVISELIAADLELGVPSTARLLPNANALLVTARPSTVNRIADVIEIYNGRVSQSVRINITVYEVTSTTENSVGTRLQAVVANQTGAFVGGWEVRPVTTDAQFVFEVLNPTNRFAGTDALLEWLNREGDATINFNDSIEVRNNQIAASSSTRTYQYISSITRQQDALGRERTEVQREQLRTGWSISVHPTIGRDAVTVRLSLARRSLVEERPFQFGESVGTNFVTDDQVRAMTVSLADGESRIITALQASDERKNRSKIAGLVTRKGGSTAKTESVLLMRVELI